MTTTATLYATSATQVTGTAATWTTLTNATGSTSATYAQWTNGTASVVAGLELSGYNGQTAIGAQPASIDSVSATVKWYTSTATTRITSATAQLYSGTTAIGAAQALTITATTTNVQTVTFPTMPTWAQAADLRVRLTFNHFATAQTVTLFVDYVGLAVGYTAASVGIRTLTDDFTTQDAAKWSGWATGVAVVGGTAQITPTAAYPGITSVGRYNAKNAITSVELIQPPNQGNGSTSAFLVLLATNGTGILRMGEEGGTLYAQWQLATGGGWKTYASTSFNATAHKIWRIRESGGSLYYETSSNGFSWSVLYGPVATPVDLSSVQVNLQSGFWGTEPSPGVSQFDNVNATYADPPPSPRTFYVDPAGVDTADGLSTGTAWKTIAKLNATSMYPGDVVLFKAGGTWSEALTVSGSGTAAAPITYGSYGTGAKPILDGGGASGTAGVRKPVEIYGSFITVQDLEVRGSIGNDILINGPDCIVQRCTVRWGAYGIKQGNLGARAQILNNTIVNVNYLITGTTNNDDTGAMGILLSGDSAVVAGNTISGCWSNSPDYGIDGSAIDLYQATNAQIYGNKASECVTFAELGDPTTSNTLIHHNTFTSTLSVAAGLTVHGAAPFGPVAGTVFHHNTVVLTGGTAQCTGVWMDAGTTMDVRNNILVATGSGKTIYAGAAITEAGNVLFGGSYTLTGQTLDATSTVADPHFVANYTDLHLYTDSPAVDRGAYLGYNTDLDGVAPVGAGMDSGAYEATATPAVLASTTGGGISLAGSPLAQGRSAGTGSITLGGTSVPQATTTASGAVSLAGSATPRVAATTSGGISLGAAAGSSAPVVAAGSVSLGGSASAQAPKTTAGVVTLGGTATGVAPSPASASGSMALGGTASPLAGGVLSTGGVSLGGVATAKVAATTGGSISLGGAASSQAPVTAGGTVSLGGTSTAASSTTAGGVIVLSGATNSTAPSLTSGSISLAGTASPQTAIATGGVISLSGSATPRAASSSGGVITLNAAAAATVLVGTAGAITLTGSTAATAPVAISGGVVTLGGSAPSVATAVATGSILLGGAATSGIPSSSSVGSITLTGAAAPLTPATMAGAVVLGGTSVPAAPQAATGGITLTGTSPAQAASTGAGSIALSGATAPRAAVAASGVVTLGGAADQKALSAASGAVALGGTVSAQVAAGTGGSITLDGTVSGSGLFTPVPADMAVALDATSLDRGSAADDVGVATDAAAIGAGRAVDDAAALTDVGVSSLDMPRAAADDSSVIDAIAVSRGLAAASDEVAVLSDTATTVSDSHQVVGDAAGVVDSVTVGMASAGQQSVADNLLVSDSVDAAHAVVQSAADLSLATDGVQVSRGLSAAGADLAGGFDSAAVRQDQSVGASDVVSATDSVVPLLSVAGGSSVADQVGLSDAASGQQGLVRAAADSAVGSDLVSVATGFVRAVTDLAAGSDSVVVGLGTGAGIADVAAGTDQVESAAATNRSVADLAVAGDVVSVIRTVSYVAADVVAAADAAGTGAGGVLSVSDESSVTDQVVLARGVASSDAVATSDAVTVQLIGDVYRTYFEDVVATDSVQVVRTVAVTAADQATGRDALSLGDLFRMAVLDATAVVESQSRSVGSNTGVQQVHRLSATASVGVDAVGSVGVDPQHAVVAVRATGTLRRPTSVAGEVGVSPRIGAAQLWAIRALTDVLVRELEKYVNGDWKPVPSADLRPAPVHYPTARPVPVGAQPLRYKRVFGA